jgi:trimeric autotransporter adhesin
MIKGIIACALACFLSAVAACGDNTDPTQVASVELTPPELLVAVGTSSQLTVNATLVDGTVRDLTSVVGWTSSDPTVATVAFGVVSGVKAGTATVTASVGGLSRTASVTVTGSEKTVVSLQINPASVELPNGVGQQLTAIATWSDNTNQDVTMIANWSSSNLQIANVGTTGTQGGAVSTLAVGDAVITATFQNKSATSAVKVTAATLLAIDVTPPTTSIAKGVSQALVATGKFSDTTSRDVTELATWSSNNPTAVSVLTPGNVKAISEGSSTVTATFAGQSGSANVTVTAATLVSIEVAPPTINVAKGRSQAFTATGIFSDNTTTSLTAQATWASATLPVATIDADGTAHAVSAGTSVISATFAGITGSTLLTVTNAVLERIDIEPSNPTVAKGVSQQFTAIGTFSDASTSDITTTVVWSSSNAQVATISTAGGLALTVGVGTSDVTAASGAINRSTTLTVTNATLVSIEVTPTNATVPRGLTQQYTAQGTFSDGSNLDLTTAVLWSSSSDPTASISNADLSRGLATATAVGATTISASKDGITGSTQLTVSAARIVSIDVQPSNDTVAKGLTKQFTATATFTDSSTSDVTSTALWSSSVATIASVSNSPGTIGLARGLLVGGTTMKATIGAISGSTLLTVTAASLVSIEVSPGNLTIAAGVEQQYAATGTFTDGSTADISTQVTWASAQSAASINSAGLAKGATPGSTTISAALNSITGSTGLTVTTATLVSINVTPATRIIARGLTLQYTATATFTDGTTPDVTNLVTWSALPANLASISNGAGSKGLLSALNAGAVTVRAQLGAVISPPASLTITSAAIVSIEIRPSNSSAAKGTSRQFIAIATFTDGSINDLTTTLTWQSSATTVATISNTVGSKGLASTVAVGSTTIRAFRGVTGGGIIEGTTSFTVTAASLVSIQITPAAPSIPRGLDQQFQATGTFTDGTTQNITADCTWTTSQAMVMTISNAAGSEGLGHTVNTGTATIVATVGTLSGQTRVTVTAAVLTSIAIAPSNATIFVGETAPFTATGTFTDGSTSDLTVQATWRVGDISLATVSNAAGSEGFVTGVNPGSTSVTAQFGSITGTTNLTVEFGD